MAGKTVYNPHGTYYVAAGAAGKHKGTYTLSVTEPPDDFAADAGTTGTVAVGGTGGYGVSVAEVPDDFAAGTGTTGAVAVGGTATGEIEQTGDSDWFAVTLEAGKTYRVDLKGKDTGDGTLEDPYLNGLYDADGNRVGGTTTWDDDGGAGRNSLVRVTAEADGTYYVAAGAAGKHKGTYTLSVAESRPTSRPARPRRARSRSAARRRAKSNGPATATGSR